MARLIAGPCMNHRPRRRFWRGAAAHGGKATLFCAYYTIATDICKPFFPFPAGKICPKIRAKNPKKPAISAKARHIPCRGRDKHPGKGPGKKTPPGIHSRRHCSRCQAPQAHSLYLNTARNSSRAVFPKNRVSGKSLPMLTAPLSFSQSTRCNKQDDPRGDGREQ